MESSTAAFGLAFVVVALLAFVYFRRPHGAYLDTTDLPKAFIDGFREGCDALGVAPVVDGYVPESEIVVTARPELYPAHRRVTYGGRKDPGAIATIEADIDAMIKAAVDHGMKTRRAHRFVFLYDDATLRRGLGLVQYPTSLYLKTTPEKALEDAFAVVQTRVVDAFVPLAEGLEFDRDKFQQSKALIACGYESPKADASVFYDAREQGYLAAVLAHNNDKTPLFVDSMVRTKMYVKEKGNA
jgi:hypothetical protein